MQKSASKNAVVFPTDVPASEASYPTKLIIFHLSEKMTIFCSAWDEKWARVQNPLSLKMIEIKAWNHLEMNLMLVKQKVYNICKTLRCIATAEAEEKSQVVIQKSSASFSNGKNDDRAQNSQL